MVEREHWGLSAILDRVVREDVTEACTNYSKEGREPAVLISRKRATESRQQMQMPQVRNSCGILATPNESQCTCLRVSKGKVPEVRQVMDLGVANTVELCRPL